MEKGKITDNLSRFGVAIALSLTMAAELRTAQASSDMEPRIVLPLCYAKTNIIDGGGKPLETTSIKIVGQKKMKGYTEFTLGLWDTPENRVSCQQIKANKGRVDAPKP